MTAILAVAAAHLPHTSMRDVVIHGNDLIVADARAVRSGFSTTSLPADSSRGCRKHTRSLNPPKWCACAGAHTVASGHGEPAGRPPTRTPHFGGIEETALCWTTSA